MTEPSPCRRRAVATQFTPPAIARDDRQGMRSFGTRTHHPRRHSRPRGRGNHQRQGSHGSGTRRESARTRRLALAHEPQARPRVAPEPRSTRPRCSAKTQTDAAPRCRPQNMRSGALGVRQPGHSSRLVAHRHAVPVCPAMSVSAELQLRCQMQPHQHGIRAADAHLSLQTSSLEACLAVQPLKAPTNHDFRRSRAHPANVSRDLVAECCCTWTCRP